MRRWDRILLMTACVMAVVIVGANFLLLMEQGKTEGRRYRVEANRVVEKIREKGLSDVKTSEYETITEVVPLSSMADREKSFFEGEGEDYLIREVNGTYYRIEYRSDVPESPGHTIVVMNFVLAAMSLFLLGVLFFIRQKILKPFSSLVEVPYELSKGNLAVPMKENKSRYFGRFVWGLDLLRENLEEQKKKELKLQKEKKTLILSISHDIKTPLSAIKLYAKALSKGLYPEREKQNEIAVHINQKADEIEGFVSQIVQASRGDFLQFEIVSGEFYLSELLSQVKEHYKEQQELLRIPFEIGDYADCLIKGDLDRGVEVLQNIMENALKYGDGEVLQMEITREEDCQLVTVRNSGCQLQEHELPHIFESFWRGSNAKKNEGSGLGLYICRQMMRKMDGEVYAEMKDGMMCVTAVFRMV